MHYDGCTVRHDQVTECGLECVRRTITTPTGVLTDLDTVNAVGGRATLEYLFKDERDHPALLAWFRSFRYRPAYEAFHAAAAHLGEAGYAYAWCGYDPMHEIMVKTIQVSSRERRGDSRRHTTVPRRSAADRGAPHQFDGRFSKVL